ncbi:thioredoxin domain-containing protein [Flavobacterium sp.]|uniref:thioredoxin domain-containing protein n=1 Tax=Flavobacterium sp. TaxID=239 RepID=UPI0026248BBE|nr:thioredoxin domain-containing protein [Flavobacterium sp.]
MNELSQESSPYLLQHAQNPVHWKAWNARTLSEAKTSNQLLIVSIGYSACHWCHVMEHESFEDEEVAKTMNAHFTSIKVDREERPDVDAVYMKAIQIMTGRGGWPLNIVALPDGRPVWGGTYFRKNEWINSLEQLQELYQTQPEKMIEYAEKLQAGLESLSIIPESKIEISQDLIIPLIEKWKKSFDPDFGGMARAPKFMMPNNYAFLMRYAHQNNDQELLDFVDLTLTKMAYGGLFDTVDGGFSRYSVDIKWHVPHFEKMLYDNGQLVSLYADAYKRTKNPLYQEVIEKTLRFVSKEWLTDEGAFYSALDADSLNPEQKLEEGAFYVWTETELKAILQEDFDLFRIVFNINPFGHWEHDNYVLIQSQSLEAIAQQNQISVAELQTKKQQWEKKLYEFREQRSKPRLDDKCLTSWNALMLKGFVDAYKALQDKQYLETALQNAKFIIKKLWASEGNLWHSYKNNQPSINGFLEDYAAVIDAFIALYEVTFDEQWLGYSKQLTDYSLDHFYEENSSFFTFKSDLDEALISQHYETEDNVVPASNSMMEKNLYKLSVYFNHSFYEKISTAMIHKIIPNIDYPSAFSNWLDAFLNLSPQQKEFAICAKEALGFSAKLYQEYCPNVVVAGTTVYSSLPFLTDRFIEDKNLFYVCQNKTCHLPVEDFETAWKDLIR